MTTPALYGIDATAGLVAINASNGQKTTVGPIPAFVGSGSGAGFTYSELTGTAYVNFRKVGSNGAEDQVLYTMNLANGQTAQVGVVDNFPPGLLQIAAANAQAVPEPGTMALAVAGAVLLIFWRRKARA